MYVFIVSARTGIGTGQQPQADSPNEQQEYHTTGELLHGKIVCACVCMCRYGFELIFIL